MTSTLTMPEAAKALRKSRRWLQDWLAKHPVDAYGRPFYSTLDRTKVFKQADIDRISEEIGVQSRVACFIYFVECAGHIKIGKADNWRKRISSIRTASPLEVEILVILQAHVGFERDLHAKFEAYRHRGEWFRDSQEIRDFIKKVKTSKLFVPHRSEQ